jgi:hypothetical protein
MYPLGAADSGPAVRISQMRAALSQLCDLDVVAGLRWKRAAMLARYAAAGRLRRLDGIYVESSTFLPAPSDLAFLALARALRIPVMTFIRDAYPLFPEYFEATSVKRRAASRLFMPAFRSLMAVSDMVAFPSPGLARLFGGAGARAILLPPGASAPVRVARSPNAHRLLHVGGVRWSALGGDLMLRAVERARAAGNDVRLTCVCRPGDEPAERPSWLEIVRASGDGIHALLDDTFATLIARRRGAYNDLAVPIKVMEYLSYGRPMLVTDCTETARIVRDAGAGLVVRDTAEALAEGIGRLFAAPAAELDAFSEAALVAAERNSWHARARQVLDLLTKPGG